MEAPSDVSYSLVLPESKLSEIGVMLLKDLSGSIFGIDGDIIQINIGTSIFYLGGERECLLRIAKRIWGSNNHYQGLAPILEFSPFMDIYSNCPELSVCSNSSLKCENVRADVENRIHTCDVTYIISKDSCQASKTRVVMSIYTNALSNWLCLQVGESFRNIFQCTIGSSCLAIQNNKLKNDLDIISASDSERMRRTLRFSTREAMQKTLLIFNFCRLQSISDLLATSSYLIDIVGKCVNFTCSGFSCPDRYITCRYSHLYKAISIIINDDLKKCFVKMLPLDNVIVSIIDIRNQSTNEQVYILDLRSDVLRMLASSNLLNYSLVRGGSLSILLVSSEYRYRRVSERKLEIAMLHTPIFGQAVGCGSHEKIKIDILSDNEFSLNGLFETLNTINVTSFHAPA